VNWRIGEFNDNANRRQKPHRNSHEKTRIYLTAEFAEDAKRKEIL